MSDLDFLNQTLQRQSGQTQGQQPDEPKTELDMATLRESLRSLESTSESYLAASNNLPDFATLDEEQLADLLAELDNVEGAADDIESRLDGLLNTLDGMLDNLEGVARAQAAGSRNGNERIQTDDQKLNDDDDDTTNTNSANDER